MNILLLSTTIIIFLIWFIRRYIYSPHITEQARQQFILNILRNHTFSELITKKEETYSYKGRNLFVHWRPINKKDSNKWIIEVDVHPSKFPISISSSEYICLRDEDHFKEVQEKLIKTEDYSFILAVDEDFKNNVW